VAQRKSMKRFTKERTLENIDLMFDTVDKRTNKKVEEIPFVVAKDV
jgi:hypothetical protein